MTNKLEAIDELNFEREVLGCKLPYLLTFSATWCAPCRALQPILEQVADEYRGQLRVGKIDMDDAPAVCARFGVRGAPTLIMFRDGKEQSRQLGLTSQRALVKVLGLAEAS